MKVSAEPPVFFEEVLVTRSDLEEKTALTAELRTRVEELKMENEYQLRLKVKHVFWVKKHGFGVELRL